MKTLPGLIIKETLYEDERTIFCRGVKTAGNIPILAKTIKEYPAEIVTTMLGKEKKLIDEIAHIGIIKALELIPHHRNPALVLEDFPGRPLALSTLAGRLDIPGFIKMALELAEILNVIHEKRIVHNNITPWAIFVNESNMINSAGATAPAISCLERSFTIPDTKMNYIPDPSLTSLAYLSPEAIKKINHGLDSRSDLYSLGCVLYELATGGLPFTADNASDLVYAHITEKPREPNRLKSEFPATLSKIIMKLLEKSPDTRYQSARGLSADLKKCHHWGHERIMSRSFHLGSFDDMNRLHIPDRLYDREEEMAVLSSVYDKASKRQNMLTVVAGRAGTGKTALIMEFRKKTIGKKGFFITGKFDQYSQDIPLFAFINAFGSLVSQIQTKSDEEIHAWKSKIIEALHPNAKLIIDLIPELEIVIGSQEPVQKTDPLSARNRLYLYLQKFMEVFTGEDHPFIFFLDDLHWADSASLNLLKMLSTRDELNHLCLIGAYRDDEVGPTHPLTEVLQKITRKKEIIIINPKPIRKESVGMLVAETFHAPPVRTKELSNLVFDKTMGNPLYVHEFLRAINSNNLVTRDHRGRWRCDFEGIRALPASDNVIDLLTAKINELPANQREYIMTAACIGSSFARVLLSRALCIQEKETGAALKGLIATGMIVQENGQYRFIHDRIQEAAYHAMAPAERINTHYLIGKMLFEKVIADGITGNIFTAVDQLNRATGLMDERERIELADLNYLAGKKAKVQAAFEMSLKYLRTSFELLSNVSENRRVKTVPERVWKCYYHLTYIIHLELADAEYLNGHFERSEKIIDEAIAHITNDIEKADFYNILILQNTFAARYPDAINIGLDALAPFGIDIITRNPEGLIADEETEIDRLLAGRDISSLLDLPPITDIKIYTVIKILRGLMLPFFYYNPVIADLISIKMCSLSIEFGNSPESLSGYLHYSMMLSTRFGNIGKGYLFAKFALDLSYRFGKKSSICESCLKYANFVAIYRIGLKQIQEINHAGFQAGLESGESKYTGDIYSHIILNLYSQGRNLNHVHAEASKFLNFISRTKDQLLTVMIEGLMFNINHLKERSITDKKSFSLNRENLIKRCRDNSNLVPLYVFYCYEAQVLYLLGEYRKSLGIIKEGINILKFFSGFITIEVNFYKSLVLASLLPDVSKEEKIEFMAALSECRQKLKLSAEGCPENFLHKYLLVEAEAARISGRQLEAIDLYDRAIEDARKNEFTQDQAIASERAGRFWLDRGNKDIAGIYIAKAYILYKKWGSLRKVRDCEEKYPDLVNHRPDNIAPVAIIQGGNSPISPDFNMLLNISQDIMRETNLEKLLEKLLTSAVKNSSAQKGYILMEKNGSFLIEAEIQPRIHKVKTLHSSPLKKTRLPLSIILYVARSGDHVILNDATEHPIFKNDPYIITHRPKSILCHKMEYMGKTTALIYLENRIMYGAFGNAEQDILGLMSSQSAIALENARLYKKQEETLAKLEESVRMRDRLLLQYEDSHHKNLQERMRPHFIYNALHTIHALLQIDPLKADAALMSFGEICRYYTDRSFESLVPFQEEWSFTRNYLNFEQIRLKNKFTYAMKTAGSFANVDIPPLLIQPLTENSIKHGFKKKHGAGCIEILAAKKKNSVTIEITDNGTGLHVKDPFTRTLGNIANRLRFHFRDSDILIRNNRGAGTRVSIRITLDQAGRL